LNLIEKTINWSNLYGIIFFSEIQRIQNGGKTTAPQEASSKPLTDVTSDKYIKVSEKVLIPIKQFPKVS
jgi:hypothetical protein